MKVNMKVKVKVEVKVNMNVKVSMKGNVDMKVKVCSTQGAIGDSTATAGFLGLRLDTTK